MNATRRHGGPRHGGPRHGEPGDPSQGWRAPVALSLAVIALPLAFWYGYGTVAAVASLVVAWPAWRHGHRSVLLWAAVVIGVAGLVLGALMLTAAVGLCGPGIFVGRCNA